LASAKLVQSLEVNMASCQTTPKRLDTHLKAYMKRGSVSRKTKHRKQENMISHFLAMHFQSQTAVNNAPISTLRPQLTTTAFEGEVSTIPT